MKWLQAGNKLPGYVSRILTHLFGGACFTARPPFFFRYVMSVESPVAEAPAEAAPQEDFTADLSQVREGEESGLFSDDAPDDAPEFEAPNDLSDEAEPSESDESPDPWTPEVLSRAERYGYDAERARSYGSPETLERVFADLDRQAAAWAREQLKAPEPAQEEQDAPPAQTKAAETKTQEAAQLSKEFSKFEFANRDVLDEEHLKALDGMNDHYAKAFTDMRSEFEHYLRNVVGVVLDHKQVIEQFTSRQQADETSRIEREMDNLFASVGDELKPIFGEGESRALKPDSPELKARQALWEEMEALKLADERLGRPESDISELQRRALRSLHGDKLLNNAQTNARKEVLEKVSAFKQGAIHRANGQQGKPKTGLAAARNFVKSHPLMRRIQEDSI